MSEEKKEFVPIVLEVQNLVDLLESSRGEVSIFHFNKDGKDVLYFYGSFEAPFVLLIKYTTDRRYKKYLGSQKGKILESDFLTSECFMPIIEIKKDPIMEAHLEGKI